MSDKASGGCLGMHNKWQKHGRKWNVISSDWGLLVIRSKGVINTGNWNILVPVGRFI